MTKILQVFVMVFVAATIANAKSPPPGTGVGDVPANIYIALDTSGSMRARAPGAGFSYNWAEGCPTLYSSYYYYRYYRGYYNNSRMGFMTRAIKEIVTDPDLVRGANFGLQTWSSSSARRVNISKNGASQIKTMVERCDRSLYPSGGTNPGNSLREAYYYFKNNPQLVSGASCQQAAVILISDGYWWSFYHRRALNYANLLKNMGVNTFVVGFGNLGTSNYNSLANAGGTSPIVSSDINVILQRIKDYIKSVITSNLTFTSPVIMPATRGSDIIVQADFEYKQTGSWKGHLRGYALDANGNISASELWDAGKKLTRVPHNRRRIWTVMPNLAGSTSQYGNFVQSNLSKIHAETSPVTRFNTAQTAQMIDFVRGRDVFNDADAPSGVAGDRWKLSDIYHSPPIFVGAPSGTIAPSSFPTSASFKSEAEYRSAYNYESFQKSFACGVRCLSRNEIIYAGSNAGLLHAFDKSGNEKWAFMPFTYRHQWGSNNPSYASSRKSSSTYGVDGPIVARDVFVNNKWRTYLAFTTGRGGRSVYVLDVTNADKPSLVFGIENDRQSQVVTMLRGNGSAMRWSYFDSQANPLSRYRHLGYSVASPRIELKKYGAEYKWVLSFPAGYEASPTTNDGKMYFTIDLESGLPISGLSVVASDLGGANNIANSLVADADLIGKNIFDAASDVDYISVLSEMEGRVSIVDGGSYNPVLDLKANSANDRQLHFQTRSSMGRDGTFRIYGATGDYYRPQLISTAIANTVFGVSYSPISNIERSYNDLQRANSQNVESCKSQTIASWRYDLDNNERATGSVAITTETLFAPVYKPKVSSACSVGSSRMLELDYQCGTMLSGGDHDLGTGMVSSPIIYKGNIYAGISGGSEGSVRGSNVKRVGNLVVIKPSRDLSTTSELQFETWREKSQ